MGIFTGKTGWIPDSYWEFTIFLPVSWNMLQSKPKRYFIICQTHISLHSCVQLSRRKHNNHYSYVRCIVVCSLVSVPCKLILHRYISWYQKCYEFFSTKRSSTDCAVHHKVTPSIFLFALPGTATKIETFKTNNIKFKALLQFHASGNQFTCSAIWMNMSGNLSHW